MGSTNASSCDEIYTNVKLRAPTKPTHTVPTGTEEDIRAVRDEDDEHRCDLVPQGGISDKPTQLARLPPFYSEKCTTLVYDVLYSFPPFIFQGEYVLTLLNKVDASRRAEKCRSLRVKVELR